MNAPLLPSFLSHGGARPEGVEPGAAEAALVRFAERGRSSWPTAGLSAERFSARLGRHFASFLEVEAADGLVNEDVYLAYACVERLPNALTTLERHFMEPLIGQLRRAGFSEALALEARQTLLEHLLMERGQHSPGLAGYRGRSPLSSWLRVAGLRHALRARRQAGAHPEVSEDDALAVEAAADNPESALLRARFNSEFALCFTAALRALTARDRILLRQHYIDGLTIDELGRLYGTHRATAARWVARARSRLVGQTRRAVIETLGVSRSQVSELVAMIRSQLDVSVRRYLAGDF